MTVVPCCFRVERRRQTCSRTTCGFADKAVELREGQCWQLCFDDHSNCAQLSLPEDAGRDTLVWQLHEVSSWLASLISFSRTNDDII